MQKVKMEKGKQAPMSHFWKTELIVPFWVMPHIDNALEDFFEGMSWYAVLPDNQREAIIEADEPWRLEAVTPHKPNKQHLDAALALIGLAQGFTPPEVTLTQEEERDWIVENLEQFPPIEADCFYIYGSHITAAIPQDKITIKMDASTAFGTGKHATTKSCLLALAKLKEQNIDIKKALDMGTGSGILSFAMAKLWDCSILAVDIDEDAPAIVKRYGAENHVEGQITALLGDGYHTPQVQQAEGFDCIVANILANPLIDMAPMLAAKLKKGGYGIISGFLTSDEERVLKAHTDCGLKVIHRIEDDNWLAITLQAGLL